jgi:beta-galactosidase
MDRRDFLRSGTLALGAGFASRSFAVDPAHSEKAASERLVFPLNRNWRYSPKIVDGVHAPEFDDINFERVAIPHTNIRLPWHSLDEKTYQFVSVYRRRFRLPPETDGQHVFVDFEGVMTVSSVWLNGTNLGEYKGGYTPFSFELTPHVHFDAENVLVVEVDSTERADIPPFGDLIDYLTFGGIYREVSLRIVPSTFLENVSARPRDVLTARPALDEDCFVQNLEPLSGPLTLEVQLCDRDQVLAKATKRVSPSGITATPVAYPVRLEGLNTIRLWDLSAPNLYTLQVRLLRGGKAIDQVSRRFGFREARFTERGFELNGKIVKLRGLDRHQTFPWVGHAMPARAQRRDAEILRKELKCNIVRTSHYPQSHHFLDACDELGLLVLEEIPGWQHIGDEAWKQLAIDNVGRMIRRDWNHPSIVLWGVRINESSDDHDFYTRTNALAHQLDPRGKPAAFVHFRNRSFWKMFSR